MRDEAAIAEYRAAVLACALCAKMLRQHDLPKLLQDIERADSFGCFTDPTLWIQNRDKMNEDRKIIEAALPLYRLGERFEDTPPA